MADIPLSPPPYTSGNMTPAWIAWFRTLYARVGLSVALSNTELEALHTEELAALQTQITTLSNTVSVLQTEVTSGLSDLGQGPVL